MKVRAIARNLMYTVLQHGFRALQLQPHLVELGVCKGDNAQQLLDRLDPELLELMDARTTASNRDYCPSDPLPAGPCTRAYDFCFGGPTWQRPGCCPT